MIHDTRDFLASFSLKIPILVKPLSQSSISSTDIWTSRWNPPKNIYTEHSKDSPTCMFHSYLVQLLPGLARCLFGLRWCSSALIESYQHTFTDHPSSRSINASPSKPDWRWRWSENPKAKWCCWLHWRLHHLKTNAANCSDSRGTNSLIKWMNWLSQVASKNSHTVYGIPHRLMIAFVCLCELLAIDPLKPTRNSVMSKLCLSASLAWATSRNSNQNGFRRLWRTFAHLWRNLVNCWIYPNIQLSQSNATNSGEKLAAPIPCPNSNTASQLRTPNIQKTIEQLRTLLGAKGIATRSKDATRGSWPYY